MRPISVRVKCRSRWHVVEYDGRRLSFKNHKGPAAKLTLNREAMMSEFGGKTAERSGCGRLLRAWRTGDEQNLPDALKPYARRRHSAADWRLVRGRISRTPRAALARLEPAARARVACDRNDKAVDTCLCVSDVLTALGVAHKFDLNPTDVQIHAIKAGCGYGVTGARLRFKESESPDPRATFRGCSIVDNDEWYSRSTMGMPTLYVQYSAHDPEDALEELLRAAWTAAEYVLADCVREARRCQAEAARAALEISARDALGVRACATLRTFGALIVSPAGVPALDADARSPEGDEYRVCGTGPLRRLAEVLEPAAKALAELSFKTGGYEDWLRARERKKDKKP